MKGSKTKTKTDSRLFSMLFETEELKEQAAARAKAQGHSLARYMQELIKDDLRGKRPKGANIAGMKSLTIVAGMLLMGGCAKEDKEVRYEVTGAGSTITYVDKHGRMSSREMYAHWQDVTDTVITGPDTVVHVVDSVQVPEHYELSYTTGHATRAELRLRQTRANFPPTTGTIRINGVVVASGTVSQAGEELVLTDK